MVSIRLGFCFQLHACFTISGFFMDEKFGMDNL